MAAVNTQKSEKEVVFTCPYSEMFTQEIDFGDYKKKYYILDCGDRTSVIVRRGDEVLLVRQHRYLANGLSWELPGGKVDKSEGPLRSAYRECLEETGIDCRDLKLLIKCQETMEAISSPMYLYTTDQFDEVKDFKPDPREIVSMHWVPFKQCLKMIKDGQIEDSCTILALLAYKVYGGA